MREPGAENSPRPQWLSLYKCDWWCSELYLRDWGGNAPDCIVKPWTTLESNQEHEFTSVECLGQVLSYKFAHIIHSEQSLILLIQLSHCTAGETEAQIATIRTPIHSLMPSTNIC